MSHVGTTLVFFGISDKGLVRENNEDHFMVADLTRKVIGVYENQITPDLICHDIGVHGSVFAVADGLGGHEKGEVASQVAVEETVQALFDRATTWSGTSEWLTGAVEKAHSAIRERSGGSECAKGMGSTLTVIHIGHGVMTVAQIGDSRAYTFRDGKLTLLTEDQTLVGMLQKKGILTAEQAQTHPSKHVILQALGQDKAITPDLRSYALQDDDYLLLCTDGLTSYVDHHTIETILASADNEPTHCQRLIEASYAAGGGDNVTVLLVRLKMQGVQETS